MTKLYLIRHAEAEGNIYRRMHGQYDALITQNGLAQIRALEQRFAAERIDAVYASDLYRTRRTAQAICAPKGLVLHREPRFREVSVGVWEDRPFGELERGCPEALAAFSRDPERWYIPGAETYEQYSARFTQALREIAEAHPDESVAIFTHGCVLSGGLHRLFGLPHDGSRADNTAVSLLEYENGRFTPVYFFDNSHLSESISTRARQRWWRLQGGRFNLWFREAAPADAALFDPVWAPPSGDSVWIACLDDEAVGYVSFRNAALTCIWLRPEYRHRRMGDQLLGQAVSVLRAGGAAQLQIGVPTANLEALSFFARHAFPEQMDDIYTVYRMNIHVPS